MELGLRLHVGCFYLKCKPSQDPGEFPGNGDGNCHIPIASGPALCLSGAQEKPQRPPPSTAILQPHANATSETLAIVHMGMTEGPPGVLGR